MTDPVDEAAVWPHLTTQWLGRQWRWLPECRSTNDEAANWARAGHAPAGAVVVADAQSHGRGRLGRSWSAPPGQSLLFSVVLRPSLSPRELPPLTLAIGLALVEAARAAGVDASLKWPNDLLLDGKKAGGVLTEMACRGTRVEHVIAGVGVNLNVAAFPVELPNAASLHSALGRPVVRAEFAALLCGALERCYQMFVQSGPAAIVSAWKKHARFLGQEARVADVTGTAEDVLPDGTLRMRVAGRVVDVVAGDLLIAT